MKLGYRLKLLFTISMISIFMLGILITSRMLLMKDILQDRTLTRVETIGNILLYDMQQKLLDDDIEGMKKTAVVTASQKQIKFVSIIDKNNNIIFSSEQLKEGIKNPYKNSTDIKKEKKLYVKSFNMQKKNENIGSIQIGFLLKTIQEDVQKIVYRTIVVGIIPLILIIYLSWFMSGQLLKPLYKMKYFAEKISKGNFSNRLGVESNDIIGELAISLNDMAKQLGDLTKNLNKKIEEATKQLLERTQALEKSNIQLKELDKLKSEFVSIVSHELRTPLTGIIGFTKTLLNIKVSSEQHEKYLKII